MNKQQEIRDALKNVFTTKHIDAVLRYFEGAIEKYQEKDWETSVLKEVSLLKQ